MDDDIPRLGSNVSPHSDPATPPTGEWRWLATTDAPTDGSGVTIGDLLAEECG